MDEGEMALAIAHELDRGAWTALGLDIGEIFFTNEDGEKFLITVEKVDKFPDED